MNIQEDIKKLQEYEAFARFVKMIHDLREETIEEMHEAPTDRLQQLSGRIISYDQIIQMSDLQLLRNRFSDFM
jgi:hypothetical protein|tara:strand:- start:1460 stop:1678 length:219 start_codon:yes stop_codon:yes gene_type:complete